MKIDKVLEAHGIGIVKPLAQEPSLDNILFHDDFSNVALSQSQWELINGRFVFNEGYTIANQTVSNVMATKSNLPSDNISIEAEADIVLSEGIVFRTKDYSNHFRFQIEAPGHAFLAIYENGVKTEIWREYNSISLPSYGVTMRVELRGSNMNFFINGVKIKTSTSTKLMNENLHGIFAWTNEAQIGRSGKFYDFKVEQL